MRVFEDLLSHYILKEAISLKSAKEKRLSKKYSGAYTNRLNDVFKSKNRILSNLKIDYSHIDSPILRRINELLYDVDYTIAGVENYIKGIAFKFDGDTMVADKKNPVKIGKLLQKFEPDGEIKVTHRVDGKKTTKTITGKPLLHEFKNDPIRATNGEFVVVISRHPYDIAGASTDRSWTSCMDLGLPRLNYPDTRVNVGINKKYISTDIEAGTLVAYIVTKDELYIGPNGEPKVKLQKPLSRILIKPHMSEVGPVYTVGKSYGSKYPEFYQKVKEWVSKTLNNKLTGGETIYRNRQLYDDSDTPVDFNFDEGSSIVGRILNDNLRYLSEKELGNQITFETIQGNEMVEVNMNIQVRFPDDIVRPFNELNDVPPYKVDKIHSPIERALAKTVFGFGSLYMDQRTVNIIDPRINMISTGDGIDIEVSINLPLYDEDNKMVDYDDYEFDVIHPLLDWAKNFHYTRLQKRLYNICSQYDWTKDEKTKETLIQQSLECLASALPILGNTPALKSLRVISPEQALELGVSGMNQLFNNLRLARTGLYDMWRRIRQFEESLPRPIASNVTYKHDKSIMIYNWCKKTFNIDLEHYVDNTEQLWSATLLNGLSSQRRNAGDPLEVEELETLRDINEECNRITGHIHSLIGDYLDRDKI